MKGKKRKKPASIGAAQAKMINDLTRKFMGNDVKLRLLQNSGIMINGLEFTFMGESSGKASDKGFAVSFACDEIDKGRLTFSSITLIAGDDSKNRKVVKRLERIKKSDGKYIYQAKFKDIAIPEENRMGKKERLEQLLSGKDERFIFKVTPGYEGEEECEVLITFYPYENILTGADTMYKKVTSNLNYYADSLKK